jgi:hypothetical protein
MKRPKILDEYRVLKLNKHWRAIGVCSVALAIKSMTKESKNGDDDDRPFRALHIDYPRLEDGAIDYQNVCSILPVKWADWCQLPVRPFDLFLRTINTAIRVPTIIIAENYEEIPLKKPQYSAYEVFRRDKGIDQYTGQQVPRAEGNIDHVVSRDKGGTTKFENCVYTSRFINELKGNLTLSEFTKKFGYKLIRKPTHPNPRLTIVNRYNISDWELFLKDIVA